MGLYIRILGAEELLGPVNGQLLHHIGMFTAAVVAMAGIALSVLIGEDRSHGRHNSWRYPVLRGDQLDVICLPVILRTDSISNLRIFLINVLPCVHRLPPSSLRLDILLCGQNLAAKNRTAGSAADGVVGEPYELPVEERVLAQAAHGYTEAPLEVDVLKIGRAHV